MGSGARRHRLRWQLRQVLAKAALRKFLLGTGERIIVEASPVDRIWGVGLASDNPRIGDPSRWDGLNLLGFELMKVRSALRA
jgi:ribA/ribD-fused uncharacterized protein